MGPEHASMLNAANNLGNLYQSEGRLEDAEIMCKRAPVGKELA